MTSLDFKSSPSLSFSHQFSVACVNGEHDCLKEYLKVADFAISHDLSQPELFELAQNQFGNPNVFLLQVPDRIGACAEEFRDLISCPISIGIVEHGYDPFLFFDFVPHQTNVEKRKIHKQLHSARNPSHTLAVNDLISRGIIERVPSNEAKNCYISNLFGVPKTSGEIRWILNAKKLNVFQKTHKFKAEHLPYIIASLQPGDFLTKIDLKDAYHHLKLTERSKNLSGLWMMTGPYFVTLRWFLEMLLLPEFLQNSKNQ